MTIEAAWKELSELCDWDDEDARPGAWDEEKATARALALAVLNEADAFAGQSHDECLACLDSPVGKCRAIELRARIAALGSGGEGA